MKITPKFIDQPIILNKLDKHMPSLLIGAGGLYGIYDSAKNSKGRGQKLFKNAKCRRWN